MTPMLTTAIRAQTLMKSDNDTGKNCIRFSQQSGSVKL